MQVHPQRARALALGGLSETVQVDFLAAMQSRQFHRGDHLFQQGGQPHAVFLVESGRVNWTRLTEDGNEQSLQVVGPGEAVGLIGLMDRRPYMGSAIALDEITAWELSAAAFESLVQKHPEAALLIIRLLSVKMRQVVEHIHSLSGRSAAERVITVLLEKARPEAERCVVALTHQEIAQISGLARETVSRVLAELQRRGTVSLTRSAVLLRDPSLLWEALGMKAGT